MDQEIVKELIQQEFNKENLVAALKKLLNTENAAEMKRKYSELKNKLGVIGASGRTADLIIKAMHQ